MPEEVIIGMAAFQERLKRLEFALRTDVLKEAAKAGAVIALEAIKANAPRDTGTLIRGLRARAESKSNDANEGEFNIRATSRAWYWRIYENGSVNQPARPFVGPAIRANRDRILAAIREKLIHAVETALK